jgi:hypothetical protein
VANNITIKDGAAASVVLKSTDNAGIQTPHHNVDTIAAGANNIGKVSPADDQDPIFNHAVGTKTSVTTSTTIVTPPANCKYVRISTDVDVFVNTAGSTAVDDGTSIRLIANLPEIVPVTAGTAVTALSSSGTATVRCTPLKTRS